MLSLYYSRFLESGSNRVKLTVLLLLAGTVAAIESIVLPKSLSALFAKHTLEHVKLIAIVFTVFVLLFYMKIEFDRHVSSGMQDSARQKLLEAIVLNSSGDYTELDIGDYIIRIADSTSLMTAVVKGVLHTIIPQTLTLIGIAIYVCVIDIHIGFCLIGSLCTVMIIIALLGPILFEKKERSTRAFYALFNTLDNKFRNLMNIYLNSQEHAESGKIRSELTEYKHLYLESTSYVNYITIGLIINFVVFYTAAMYIYVRRGDKNDSVLKVLLVFSIVTALYLSKESPVIMNNYGIARYSKSFLTKLIDTHARTHEKTLDGGSVAMTNVTFGYKPGAFVFKNAHLKIRDKEKVAIVGRSGSGKSTLAKLLTKFYNYAGRIEIGGVDIRRINASYLRKKVLYVNQRMELVDGSVIYNMKYGSHHVSSDASVQRLLRKYNLTRVFSSLRNGVYEKIATHGSNISLGMQKIIFLIRAMLKLKDALVVIIDEPLAGLDQATRRNVLRMIQAECAHKTVIIITHDMEVRRIVDRVIDIAAIQGQARASGRPRPRPR